MSKISLKLCKFSPWISLNSLELDLGKIIKPCNSFLAKVRESQGTWVKARESQGTLLEKTGWKPWRGVTQFCRIHSCKSLFEEQIDKSKKLEGGGEVQKSIYIQIPSVWSFSGITHTQGRNQGVPCMSSTRLARSGLPSLI